MAVCGAVAGAVPAGTGVPCLCPVRASAAVPLEVVLGDDALHLARVRVEVRVRVKGER